MDADMAASSAMRLLDNGLVKSDSVYPLGMPTVATTSCFPLASPPSHTFSESSCPLAQHTPSASRTPPAQHAPSAPTTAVDGPLHTPHAFTIPEAQHAPVMSRLGSSVEPPETAGAQHSPESVRMDCAGQH